jgi:hypothetical protein
VGALASAAVRAHLHHAAVALAIAALAGCGASTSDDGATPGARAQTTAALPALATRPAAPGEIVVRGEASPKTRGPYAFDGRYLVRFEQYAPEDPKLDFTAQTPFSAQLEPRRDDPRGAVKLVEAAARSGRAEVEIRGRRYVDVTFGDFPWVLRFTPRGS